MSTSRRRSSWFARRITGRARYPIILLWLAAAAAAYLYLPGIRATQGGEIGLLAPANSAAIHTEEASNRLFAVPATSRTVIVQHDPRGLSSAAQQRIVTRAAALTEHRYPDLAGVAGALPVVDVPSMLPFVGQSHTTGLTYLFFHPSVGLHERAALARRVVQTLIDRPGDALVGVTGVVPVRTEQGSLITGALRWVELATVIMIAVIVGLAFRAVGAALLTLLAAGTAYVLATHLIGAVSVRTHVAVPVELSPLLVVLVLAISTDYSVFFLSSARHWLLQGEDRPTSACNAATDVIPLVTVAGLTVAAGTSCLVFARLHYLQVLGPALGGAVAVTLVVALTLVPALLATFGRLLFWPRIPRPSGREDDVYGRPAPGGWRRVLRYTRWGVVVVVCLAVLLAGASGLRGLAIGMPIVNDLPGSAPARRAADAAAVGFAPGMISPTEILVQAPGITRQRAGLARLEGLIAAQPGVAGIVGPREMPSQRPFGLVLSTSGSAARYVVVLRDDPYGATAITNLRRIEQQMPGLLSEAGLPRATAGFAGDTAIGVEVRDRIVASIVPVAVATGILDLALMLLLLRSLVTPLCLLVVSVLTVAAPLGLTVYLFRNLLGHAYIDFYVPVAVWVLLFSLGADYNLFVVGRIWEEARERPFREAVAVAGAQASHAIRVAALTLGLSFATLAIIRLASFREFAFAMAVGVLVDAFLVRSYLVPALLSLLGRLSLWPHRPSPPAGEDESTA